VLLVAAAVYVVVVLVKLQK